MRLVLLTLATLAAVSAQEVRRVGRLQEAFAWKQITFNIDGDEVLSDRATPIQGGSPRTGRQSSGNVVFQDDGDEPREMWDQRPPSNTNSTTSTTSTTARPNGQDNSQFFIQYNNLPMGVERVGDRLFVTLPRRRFGIPSTLNYLDLNEDLNTRSPGLRPYPDLRRSGAVLSVYRTRADHCNRLWMVDTGLLEIPDNRRQVQQPAVVAFDLRSDEQVLRYALKDTDIVSPATPTGLASITLDFPDMSDCSNVFAYIPDLATYGLIVYSLRDNDSWRLSHNFFSFNPLAGNLRIAGQFFQWSDGIFSITLTEAGRDGCRTAYFHSMVGITEFSVSTCVLRNSTASQSDDFWQQFSVVGHRGPNCQSTMHGYHAGSKVVFFADIGRDAVSCWHTGSALAPTTVAILAQDSLALSYPSDLHVTGDEVWVMANSLPRWGYSRLDTNQYNFFIYRASVQDLIANTVCSGLSPSLLYSRAGDEATDEVTN